LENHKSKSRIHPLKALTSKVDNFLDEGSDIYELTRNINDLSLNAMSTKYDPDDAATATLLADLRMNQPCFILTKGKLREALISLRKQGDEAIDILIASAKVGILTRHTESYLPSLSTLLRFPSYPSYIRGWYALYLLCVLEDPFEFYMFTSTNALESFYKRFAVALIHGNYITYTRLIAEATPFDKALIVDSPADMRMKERMTNVVGKSYYRVEVPWLNKLRCKVDHWKIEDDMYIIRRQGQKKTPV
jgi:hypothetical protein